MTTSYQRMGAHAAGILTAVIGIPLVVWWVGVEPRLAGMVVGVLSMCVLGYQLMSTWKETTVLAKVLVVLLIVTIMVGAIGQYQIRHYVSLVTVVTYPLIGVRVACGCAGIYWRWLLRFDACKPVPRLVSDDHGGVA